MNSPNNQMRTTPRRLRQAATWILPLALWMSAPAHADDCVAPEAGPPVCLSGIVTASDYHAALVQQPGKAGLIRLRPDDVIADWSVTEIGPRFVVFGQDGQTVRMDLTDHTSAAEPAGQTASIKDAGGRKGQRDEPDPKDMDQ